MKKNKSGIREHATPIDLNSQMFRDCGHKLVDQIADFFETLPAHPVTRGEDAGTIRSLLGNGTVPEEGTDPGDLLEETARLLFDHSLFNGHPRFMGYITAPAAPIGVLGDFLASAVNSNAGGWALSPMASEIEAQTVRWIAQLIGYPASTGGLLVSGGNMANFVGFLVGRRVKTGAEIRSEGLCSQNKNLTVYVSRETHTWIEKAADLFGLGTHAIRWVDTDEHLRMSIPALKELINRDQKNGYHPFMVVGTAGTVGTGAVDPLAEIAEICRQNDLWFHVDGAYGAPAALLPEYSAQFQAIADADSVAVDPHKWFYAPLEAGCALVKEPQHMIDTFSFHPDYYNFSDDKEDNPINYYEMGLQNSRGFRALKVWLGIRQAGKKGYTGLIREDIELAALLFKMAEQHPELEALTNDLSIATFRYVPPELRNNLEKHSGYLDDLNRELLNRLQAGGEAFISNAVVLGKFALRACIVNFRTGVKD
ncbi:MAG: aspartate aminotransferase family protein, partial [Calditrichia bacterium]